MGCFRLRNSELGEMFRGFVSCDMMYREGLVSSYLVSISLPSPNSDMRTPDTESWVASLHVFLVFAECQISSSSSSSDTCRTDTCQKSCGFCLNKPPGVWQFRSGAKKTEGSEITGLHQNMLGYKHLLCQIKSLLVAKGYYIVKC